MKMAIREYRLLRFAHEECIQSGRHSDGKGLGEVWAKAGGLSGPRHCPGRESELRSCKEGACDACSEALPPMKEKKAHPQRAGGIAMRLSWSAISVRSWRYGARINAWRLRYKVNESPDQRPMVFMTSKGVPCRR